MIEEIKNYLDQKSKDIKNATKTGIAVALTAGMLLTGAGCVKTPNNPDDTNNTPNITDTENPGVNTGVNKDPSFINTPENFYKEENKDFTKVELPKELENCTGIEKVETFLKNYLLDETATLENVFIEKQIDGETKELKARVTFTCKSSKETDARNKLTNVVLDFSENLIDDLDNFENRTSLSISKQLDPNALSEQCDNIAPYLEKEYPNATYKTTQLNEYKDSPIIEKTKELYDFPEGFDLTRIDIVNVGNGDISINLGCNNKLGLYQGQVIVGSIDIGVFYSHDDPNFPTELAELVGEEFVVTLLKARDVEAFEKCCAYINEHQPQAENNREM